MRNFTDNEATHPIPGARSRPRTGKGLVTFARLPAEAIDVMRSEPRRKKKVAFEAEKVFNLPDRSDDLKLDLDLATYRAKKGEGGNRGNPRGGHL